MVGTLSPIPGLRLLVAPIGSRCLFSDRLQHLGSTPATSEEQLVEVLVGHDPAVPTKNLIRVARPVIGGKLAA